MQTLDSLAVEATIYTAIRTVKPSLAQLPMSAETRIDSLGLESIQRIMVVFEMEEAFGVSIVDEQLDTFQTVGEGRDLVLKLAGIQQTE